MAACPLSADGVHSGFKCPCGNEVMIPPISVSFEVYDKSEELVSDGFSCSSVGMAADALRRAADKLEALAKARGEN